MPSKISMLAVAGQYALTILSFPDMQACEKGAVAVMTDHPLPPEVHGLAPVVQVPRMADAVHRIAAAFYDRPSERMTTIGVTGETGALWWACICMLVNEYGVSNACILDLRQAPVSNVPCLRPVASPPAKH